MGKKGLVAKIGEVELSMPSFKVQVVDPTGAGDAFSAGILYQLVREPHYTVIRKIRDILRLDIRKWLRVLMYASACGAACCKGVGTTASAVPKYIRPLIEEEGEQILKKVERA
jgi:sugar/nucleoside kinase (ribokinase family)